VEQNKMVDVRGLKYCASTSKFIHRDRNAALNILSCYYERHEIFTRQVELERTDNKVELMPKVDRSVDSSNRRRNT
jgi:hypothetical protein